MKYFTKTNFIILLLMISLLFTACSSLFPEKIQQAPPADSYLSSGDSSSNGSSSEDSSEDSSSEDTPSPPPAPPKLGWVEENGRRYYYEEADVMSTGWVTIEEQEYYFLPSGAMATGKVIIDDQTHFFGHDGSELILVNPWNYLPEDYEPEVVTIDNHWLKVSVECYDALNELLAACRADGYKPYVASAFRSHGDQKWLYQNKINRLIAEGYSSEEANKLAGTVVAVPGTSEHELGLALDLVDDSYRNLDEAQENTAAQKWFMEHSWEYGFILRYPNDKSDITGIIYEPWHYRYVGKTIAEEIYKSGLCLEEYIESLTFEE